MHFFDIVSKITKRNLTRFSSFHIPGSGFYKYVLNTDIEAATNRFESGFLPTGYDGKNNQIINLRSSDKNE